MKKKLLSLLLFVCLLILNTGAEGQQMKSSPKNQIDISGDLNPNVIPDRTVFGQSYSNEAINAAWTTLATSPNALSRSFCVYARPGGTEYVYQFGGGGTSAQLRSIARYDIAANTWTVLPQSLNLDVSAGAAINDGDSVIYIFGGSGIVTNTLGSTQKINLGTGVVTTLAAMPVAITDAAVVKYHDTLVYVIGGGAGTFGASTVNNVQVYNIRQNTYAAATPYPLAAAMMGFGIDGNKIICAGGWDGIAGIANSYKGTIDPSNHLIITWSAIANYPGGNVTRMASYFVQKGAGKGVMFTGGAIGGATLTNKTYLFNTGCESWDSTVANSQARSNFKAAGRGDSVAWVVAGFTTVGVGTTERITFSSITCALLTNDVASISINSPPTGIALPEPPITPQATVKNVGAATQTFNVTMTISPGGYSSTKTVTSLASLASQNVNFDSYTPVLGNYTVTVYTQLATDQNRSNDTVRQSLTVIQPNYGGGGPTSGGYYFANSTPDASGAPSQPSYCRVDTAGSTTLVSNNIASVPISNGDLDDGYWLLSGITGLKKIKFMGVLYSDVYVGTNGIIAFASYTPGGGNWYPPAAGLPGGTVRPALYPAWNDLNWGNTSQPINRLSYKVDNAKNRIIITYDRAPLFGGLSTEWETFQICLELVPDNVGSPNSNLIVSHDNTTSVISIPYLVGLQDGTGANWLQYTFIDAGGNVITPGPLFDTTAGGGVSIAFGPDPNNLKGPCEKNPMRICIALEGLQSKGTPVGSSPRVRDTVTILIRDATSAPYAILQESNVYLDSAHNGSYAYGYTNLDFTWDQNQPYYIEVKHRNSVLVWSNPVSSSSDSLNYNFTSSLSQIFGNNGKLINGAASLYTGDVTGPPIDIQDGCVDLLDILNVYNESATFATGPYVLADLNYDLFVDLSDIVLVYNNAVAFVCKVEPPGAENVYSIMTE